MPTKALSDVYLKEALDVMPQQVAILDSSGVITHANKAWEHFSEHDPSLYAERGANYLNVCKDAQRHELEAASRPGRICEGLRNILAGVSEEFTLEYSHFVGTDERWFVMYIRPLSEDAGGAVISHIDVTSHRRFEQEIARFAYTDALTGLPNRRAFFERAKQMIASAKRHGRELHLFYLDLDGFKGVNDTLGHDAGDRLLVEVAERFKDQTRESDLLARLGGDEFAFLLEVRHHQLSGYQPNGHYNGYRKGHFSGQHDAYAAQVAERYRACLDAPFRLGGEEVYLGASIGVAHFPKEGSVLRTLLKEADRKMYEHKRQHKAGVATVKGVRQQIKQEGSRLG